MNSVTFDTFDPSRVPSPCFVVDEVVIEKNLQRLATVQQRSGAKILAALKAFSMYSLAPLVSRYLSGTCASGLHEALLAQEYYSGEVHVFSPGFTEQEFQHVAQFAHHCVFNSFSQWQRFKKQVQDIQQQRPQFSVGLRINPEHSEGSVELYDPCAPCSRLGIPIQQFAGQTLDGIDGLHFHTLCEQGVEPLRRTVEVVEEKFGHLLSAMSWVNFGGGHHITQDDYDVDALVDLLRTFADTYQVQVYLEPGEAVALNSGVLVAEVVDITHNHMPLAIVDTSATCHMPDTLEMPYRAEIFTSAHANHKAFTYRLGGTTCLAGDVIGDYSFDQPLQIGQRLLFDDMAHYTMVKTTTFNGINLPAIAIWNSQTDALRIVKQFDYSDFKSRL